MSDFEWPDVPKDQPEVWGGGCECWVTPEHMWTTHYGAVEPGSQVEYNPDCPLHGGPVDDRAWTDEDRP